MTHVRNGAHDFVRAHPRLSVDKLVEAAQKAGVDLDRRQLSRAHWKIAHSESVTRAQRAKRQRQKKTTKKKQGKRAAAVSPAHAHKLAQLRKLVFEIGWDAAREVFNEFQDMHGRWE